MAAKDNTNAPGLDASHPQLSNILNDDTITPGMLEALIKDKEQQMKRKEIIKEYDPKIIQLPNGRYHIRYNGKQIVRVRREDVLNAILDMEVDVELTLENIFDDYIKQRRSQTASTTWQKNINYFNTYIKGSTIGSMPLKEIKLKDGYAFLEECLEKRPDMPKKYWENIRGTLNTMIQFALDNGYMEVNPISNLKPARDKFTKKIVTKEKDKVFTPEEEATIVHLALEDAEANNNALPLGVALLFFFGMRVGELLGLKWGDLKDNGSGYYLHIQREVVANVNDDGKHNGFKLVDHCKSVAGDRYLPVCDDALDLFAKIKKYNIENSIPTGEDDLIFQKNDCGEWVLCSSRSIDSRLRKYCKKAGMEVKKSAHDVRRTVITNLAQNAMPLAEIQKIAGHENTEMTMQYLKAMPGADHLSFMEKISPMSAS